MVMMTMMSMATFPLQSCGHLIQVECMCVCVGVRCQYSVITSVDCNSRRFFVFVLPSCLHNCKNFWLILLKLPLLPLVLATPSLTVPAS